MSKEIWHITPVNDLKPHKEEGFACECKPVVKIEEDYVQVIHNSFDGREAVEMANSFLNG